MNRVLSIRLKYSEDYKVWFWYDLGGYWPRGFDHTKRGALLKALRNQPFQGPEKFTPMPPY